MSDLLTATDVAERLHCSKRYAYEILAGGELETIRLGRTVRVSVDELTRWLETKTVPVRPRVDVAKPARHSWDRAS